MKFRGILAAALALPAATAGVVGAGDPSWAFSPASTGRAFFEPVEVPLVDLQVFVADHDGRPVPGLTVGDFEVLEDGRPVTISNFRAPSPSPSAVSGDDPNPVPAAGRVEPRNLIIFFDDLGLEPNRRRATLAHLRGLVSSALPSGLRVMLVSYDGSIRVHAPPTDDPDVLAAALEELAGRASLGLEPERERILADMRVTAGTAVAAPHAGKDGSGTARAASVARRPASPALAGATHEVRSFPPRIDAYAEARRQEIGHLLAELEGFVRSLSGLPGRTAILLASDGLEMRPGEDLYRTWAETFPEAARLVQGASLGGSRSVNLGHEVRELVHFANGQGVAFYALSAPSAPVVSAELRGVNGFGAPSAASALASEETLMFLSGATGGRTVADAPGLAGRLLKLAHELEACYSLAYRPEHFGDGRYHRLTVTVRRQGLRVRYREGYLDSGENDRMTDRTLAAAVLGVTDNPLGISVEAREVQPRPDGSVVMPVLVDVPVDRLVLVPGAEEHAGRVTIVLAVQGEDGGLSAVQRREYPITIANDQLLAGLHSRVAFVLGLLMRPGPQRIAVGVRDDVSRIEATDCLEIDVPSSRKHAGERPRS